MTVYNVASIFGMHLLSFLVGIATNATTRMQSFIDYGSFNNTLKDPSFWLTSLLTAAACVLPVQAYVWWNTAYGSGFTQRLYRMDRRIEAEAAAKGAGSTRGASRPASGEHAAVKMPLLSSSHGSLGNGKDAADGEPTTHGVNPLGAVAKKAKKGKGGEGAAAEAADGAEGGSDSDEGGDSAPSGHVEDGAVAPNPVAKAKARQLAAMKS